jgi:predicted ATPase
MPSSLDKLTIKGFKSIRSLEDFELRKLNVLIGGNGAGKSNLIEFFRMLRGLIDGNLKQYIRDGGGINDFLYNGRKVTEKLEFSMRFGLRGYSFEIAPGPKESFSLRREYRFYERGRIGWWFMGNSDDDQALLVQEAKGNSSDSQYSKPVYDAISSWQIYHFHDTSKNSGMRGLEIIQDNKFLRADGTNIAPYLMRLKKSEPAAYAEIRNALVMVMPYFDDFLFDVEEFGEKKKVGLSWKQKGSDYPMQPYHFSDGSIRFVCLATALLQPDPPSTIIIDEPELGLHPTAISVLAELIQDAAKRTQLLVATQSPALIDHFAVEDVVVVNRKDGASTFERLKEEDFNSWLESYSVGELWTKNVIAGGPVYE